MIDTCLYVDTLFFSLDYLWSCNITISNSATLLRIVLLRPAMLASAHCFDPSNGTGTPDGTAKRIVHTALSPGPFLLKLLIEDAKNHTYVLLEARELNLRNALPQNQRSLSRRFRTE
jgi:hypothetical protein